MAVNAVVKFLKAAKNLADQGMSKEAIEQFARNEFGQINELFQAQINNIFKTKKGIENIKIKDPDFDDTIVKMQFDNAGVPFNPKDPLKTKSLTYEEAVAREKARADADEDYIMKIFDPEDFAKGGRAGYAVGNQVMPAVDARMNLDYNTLVNQNEAQRVTQAQNRNPGIMRPTMADVAGAVQTDPRAGIKEAFLNERLSGGERFGDAIPDFDSYGTYTGSDQLLKDYAAAGRGTPSSQLVRLPEGNPYAYGGPGYYEYDGSSFSKTADLNMTPEYEKMLRSNYNLNQINQNTVPRKITQDDIDTANFFGPMYTGFDYSQSTDWSPGQPAPDGYRVVDMMGDQFLERMYPSKEEVAGLPGMVGPMPLGLAIPPSGNYQDNFQDPDAGLSGQEYAEKYGIEYATGGRAGYYTGGMVDVEPNLSDIGHGSDALMARTRLVSPDGQATTSTGLNYLLAEDNDNIRVPFSKGKIAKEVLDKGRRGFMKAAGAAGAGIAALKTGLLGFGEKAAPVVEKAVETAKGVPPYFFQLVDVIKSKGREIKSYGERVRQYIAPSKDGKSELMLTEDLSTGDVQVKKIYKENDEMVTKSEEMNFTKGRGDETTQGTPADDYEEITEYNSRIYKDEFNDPDYVEGIDVDEIVKEIDVKKTKKADGGRIGFESGKVVLAKKIYDLLKNNKKIKEAVDNIFGTGDYKMDAEMAAESLVELNPKAFDNMLYEDLPDNVRSEIYGAVINPVQQNALMVSRMKKASKPTKTLESIKETGTIDISDPNVADEFARFMKETDPEGSKVIEQTVELSNFNPKGRKKNATGGLTSMLGE